MRQACQLGIRPPCVESAEQQADLMAPHQRPANLEDRPFPTAKRIGVAMRQDDVHSSFRLTAFLRG